MSSVGKVLLQVYSDAVPRCVAKGLWSTRKAASPPSSCWVWIAGCVVGLSLCWALGGWVTRDLW